MQRTEPGFLRTSRADQDDHWLLGLVVGAGAGVMFDVIILDLPTIALTNH